MTQHHYKLQCTECKYVIEITSKHVLWSTKRKLMNTHWDADGFYVTQHKHHQVLNCPNCINGEDWKVIGANSFYPEQAGKGFALFRDQDAYDMWKAHQ